MTKKYLTSAKNLPSIFKAMQGAQAPKRFTQEFLVQLGFTGNADRLVIGVLKDLGFLDQNGTPTDRYYSYLDPSRAKEILGEAIREAFDDLFMINKNANTMSSKDVEGKLKTIYKGEYSDDVINKIAYTFSALCNLADFSQFVQSEPSSSLKIKDSVNEETESQDNFFKNTPLSLTQKTINTQMHYNIQIHLPESTNIDVYDKIFESLKKHLL